MGASSLRHTDSAPRPTSAPDTAIRLAGITHRYGDRLALNDVSFDVRPAEIFGLLGPNGSGKTSLFRILSTLMMPSGGTADIMGANVTAAPNTVRRNIGVVFQAQSVDVKLSAAENLRHQGHLYGLSGRTLTTRIAEMLSRVGLADRANERVETFSGGMQRRVELAKGLLHRPSVLLLDEPTTGLDPGARRDLWKYLAQLRDSEGVTVLVTTHLMEEAERCDRLAILNEGKLVGLGAPAELKKEIGGDVVSFELTDSSNAVTMAEKISMRFAVKASALGGKVRLEIANAPIFVTKVVEAFLGDIKGFSVSKPSLEDVFIGRTGHRFWADANARAEHELPTEEDR
jgi:ABC-2 type transport system ATP-binding protein